MIVNLDVVVVYNSKKTENTPKNAKNQQPKEH